MTHAETLGAGGCDRLWSNCDDASVHRENPSEAQERRTRLKKNSEQTEAFQGPRVSRYFQKV